MSPKWEKYVKSLFYSEIFAQRHDESCFFLVAKAGKTANRDDFAFHQSCRAAQSNYVFLSKLLSKHSSLKLPWFATWRGTLCRYLRGSPCISLGLSVLPFNLLLYFLSVSPHPSVLALSYTFFSSLLEELGAFSCSFGDRDLNSAAGSDCSGMAAPSSKEHSSVLQFCFVGVFL